MIDWTTHNCYFCKTTGLKNFKPTENGVICIKCKRKQY